MSDEPNPQPVICPQCGQTNAQGRTECWNCKVSLVPGIQPSQSKKTSCWLVGCIIAAIIGFFITLTIIIGIVFYFKANGPGDREREIEEAIQSTVKQNSSPVTNMPKKPAPLPDTTAKPKLK